MRLQLIISRDPGDGEGVIASADLVIGPDLVSARDAYRKLTVMRNETSNAAVMLMQNPDRKIAIPIHVDGIDLISTSSPSKGAVPMRDVYPSKEVDVKTLPASTEAKLDKP